MKFFNSNDANAVIIKASFCGISINSMRHDFEICDTLRLVKAACLIIQDSMFSTFTKYQQRYIKLHVQAYHYDLKLTVVI